MTNEELLVPRFKVIANYPESTRKIGQIIRVKRKSNKWGDSYEEWLSSFPHLFQRLEWYDDRELSELPMYLKMVLNGKGDYVHKVEDWFDRNDSGQPLYHYYNMVRYLNSSCVSGMEPATEEEYVAYINTDRYKKKVQLANQIDK